MIRVKRGIITKKKHKKIRKSTTGMRGARKRTIKSGREALIKSYSYAYRDRKTKKRNFRRIWITRLNAYLKPHNLSYSQFINLLKKNKIEIDRKILSDLVIKNPSIMEKILQEIKKS